MQTFASTFVRSCACAAWMIGALAGRADAQAWSGRTISVVDPNPPLQLQFPDVAFDEASRTFLVIWRHDDGTRGQRISEKGQLISASFLIVPDGYQAKVANVRSTGQFVVVSTDSSFDIEARCVDARTGRVSPPSPVLRNTMGSFVRFDVAGELRTTDDRALVVWSFASPGSGGAIHAASLRCIPTFPPGVGSRQRVTGAWFGSDGHPSIARANDASGRHLVVWTRWLFGRRSAKARLVDNDGRPTSAEATFGPPGAAAAAVACDGRDWLVVWSEPAPVSGSDLSCQALKFNWIGGLVTPSPPQPVAGAAGRLEREPTVAFTGDGYTIAWKSSLTTSDGDVRVADFDEIGNRVGSILSTPISHAHDRLPAIAPMTGRGASRRALVVWLANRGQPRRDAIYGHLYRAGQ